MNPLPTNKDTDFWGDARMELSTSTITTCHHEFNSDILNRETVCINCGLGYSYTPDEIKDGFIIRNGNRIKV